MFKEDKAYPLYDPADEHDACGVGMVAAIDGKPRRHVVESAIAALKNVWHRGAVNADGKTGDGAGIHLQIPKAFFTHYITQFGKQLDGERNFAVGMVFLPRQDYRLQEECRNIVETEIMHFGYALYGWRQVPINSKVIGEQAESTRPEIAQVIIAGEPKELDEKFERQLYIIRKRIEKEVLKRSINGFYICSLSCRSVIYKGLFQAEQLQEFYPDLQDERFISAYAIFHQRFSTNTAPEWPLAQPFRLLAHNGEINTIRGNINWMKSRESTMASPLFGEHIEDIKPVIPPRGSDTAALDACMELLVRGGRNICMARMITIPPAWSRDVTIPEHLKALYHYCNAIMAPWDGPAAIAGTDGRWVMAAMDRNGLRPMRYSISDTGLLMVGSEAGMVPVIEGEIVEKGRLGPGEMIAVQLEEGKLYGDRAVKEELASRFPFAQWISKVRHLEDLSVGEVEIPDIPEEQLKRRQLAFGITQEDLEKILMPMVMEAKEGIGSMGDDTPLAVLSKHYRGMQHFFRQHFSQVTNPPIDSLRERRVMSLYTRIGVGHNVLEEGVCHSEHLLLETPILLSHEHHVFCSSFQALTCEIDTTFDARGGEQAMYQALERMRKAAKKGLEAEKSCFVLTDEAFDRGRAVVPMILAVGALHSYMVQLGERKKVTLLVRSSECLDVHHLAVLIGLGATTVNPYGAEATIAQRVEAGIYQDISSEQALKNYREALSQGLLKVMSKMGISVVSSYRGGRNFDAVGLSRVLVADYFPELTSRISGLGLSGIQRRVLALHHQAWEGKTPSPLPIGGYYTYRSSGETHAFDGPLIHMLQSAVADGKYQLYKEYSKGIHSLPLVNIRDLLGFRSTREPIVLEEVESITEIRKRFIAPAMSLGALSPEAHETLAIAMNRIGASSNSGEGGEGAERYQPKENGDNPNSTIKQVASGRFGVTTEYLNHCDEIQIKVAQGAKPGEGGQLPGFKVTAEIARLRHSTEGVMLISPPPHHDIYSIEDLAQLIYDLKQVNPRARVSVKLVAQSGIGTIASGVAKAMADKIVIAGHSGGTGASPYSSIKHAGVPWEIGLAEANQVLTLNRLRHRVVLQTDGGLKTGRDIVMAAMFGAEEFAIGTLSLVAMGCILVRQCHSNTCPVGICTQDAKLREKFEGTVDKVINLMSFIAEEVREILAELGFTSLNEVIGRTDLLQQVSQGSADLDTLDLGPLLALASQGDIARTCTIEGRNEVKDTLDAQMLEDASHALEHGERIQLTYTVGNTMRSIGTRLSGVLVRDYDTSHFAEDHVTIRLRGSAGQSFGAFAVKGLKLEMYGEANDYVGKGLSGGVLVIRPPASSDLVTHENVIIGNTVLFGATSGKLFASGRAGERFGVRNSGAVAVVEGCGSNGCEYMTGGTVAVLGSVGNNFAAGMTGGMAFVYDVESTFEDAVNNESVVYQRLETEHWEQVLKELIEAHVDHTQSLYAQNILYEWDQQKKHFWQVCPKDMLDKLTAQISLITKEAV